MKNKVFLAAIMGAVVLSTIPIKARVSTATTATKETTDSTSRQQMNGQQVKMADDQTMEMGKVAAITSSSITFYEGTQNGNMGQTDMQQSATAGLVTPPAKPAGDDGAVPAKPADDNGTSPAKPEGESTTGTSGPAAPTGGMPQGMSMTWASETTTLPISATAAFTKQGEQGKSETITYAKISKDDQVRLIVETAEDGTKSVVSVEVMDQTGAGMGQPAGSETGTVDGTAVKLVDGAVKTLTKQTIKAAAANQSGAKIINGGKLTLTDSTITKTGDSTATQESDFYGLNAGILAAKASMGIVSNTTISTAAEGANGVFATGRGSSVTLNNVTIKTTGNSSRGLDATYGGKVTGTNVKISTQGAHCAALATDRGEGTITVTGGTMTTSGEGSPCIYSTGNISATNATMKATGAQAAVIEGKNSITLTNSVLTGAGQCGVMLYQSFSGDAGVGTSVFNMTGGKLTATNGPIFYITNTQAIANLKNASLVGTGALISAGADRWGTEGSNGGNFTLNANMQELEGTITADDISTVVVNLKNNSSLSSTINQDQKAKSLSLSLDQTSTWKVTGDSYLSILKDADETLSNIQDNGHTIYYDASQSANSWLAGKTITLQDGGTLKPVE